MWIPQSVEEIERVIHAGGVQETETFDSKKELPTKGQNKDIAKDVSAMAADGGVLLYGVDEDANKQPTVLTPIILAGEAERIMSVVRTSIAEPPEIIIREFPIPNNPIVGYICVVIPPSPRAPHMVIMGGDYRYYGRKGKISVPLSEGDVARLYQRRQRWERDLTLLIADELKRVPLLPHAEFGYLHLFAWPVTSSTNVLDQARRGSTIEQMSRELFQAANHRKVFPQRFSPDFSYDSDWQRQGDGWKTYLADSPTQLSKRAPNHVLDLQLNFDGSSWLFCGRAAERRNEQLYLFEDIVAGLAIKFFYFLGKVYERAGYVGQVDVGVVVTHIEGATTSKMMNTFMVYDNPPPYDRPQYQRTARVSALTMAAQPHSIAEELVKPLVDVVTQERYNPFDFLTR